MFRRFGPVLSSPVLSLQVLTLGVAALCLYLTAAPLPAQAEATSAAVRRDTPSGYPVPRFVSVKGRETYCRAGPSFNHPVVATYVRAGAPVLVVAETTDHWRKIRDMGGDECWAHRSTLRAPTHAIVRRESALLARPDPSSRLRARLGAGVMARVDRQEAGWVRVTAQDIRGWVPASRLWGVEGSSSPARN